MKGGLSLKKNILILLIILTLMFPNMVIAIQGNLGNLPPSVDLMLNKQKLIDLVIDIEPSSYSATTITNKVNTIIQPILDNNDIDAKLTVKILNSIDTSLTNITWRDKAEKYYAVLTDPMVTEFNDSNKYTSIQNKLIMNNITFVGLGTINNKNQFEDLISKNSGNGVYYDNTNINNALTNLANFMVNNVSLDLNINVGNTQYDINTVKSKINADVLPKLVANNINANIQVQQFFDREKIRQVVVPKHSAYGSLDYTVIALTEKGDVYTWGLNQSLLGDGTTTNNYIPRKIAIHDVVKITAGYGYVGALTSNGEVYFWGTIISHWTTITYASPTLVAHNAKDISAAPGGNDGGAIYMVTSNDTLSAWGPNAYFVKYDSNLHQWLHVPNYPNMSNVKQISNELILTKDGKVYKWTITEESIVRNQPTATLVSGLSNITIKRIFSVQTDDGYLPDSFFAIADNGDLYVWGDNSYNQLGVNRYSNPNPITTPTLNPYISNVLDIKSYIFYQNNSAYNATTVALTTNNDLYEWGNGYQYLSYPRKIFSNVIDIARTPPGLTNYQHYDYLINKEGELLRGYYNNSTGKYVTNLINGLVPIAEIQSNSDNYDHLYYYIGEDKRAYAASSTGLLRNFSIDINIKQIVVSNNSSYHDLPILLTETGLVYYSQSPIFTGNTEDIPVGQVQGLYNIVKIFKRSYSGFYAVNNLGDIYEITYDSQTHIMKTPIKIMSISNLKQLEISSGTFLALKNDGMLWSWGNNTSGQVGDGTFTNRSTPIEILNNVSNVFMGFDSAFALLTDGRLYAWGNDKNGKLGLDGYYISYYGKTNSSGDPCFTQPYISSSLNNAKQIVSGIQMTLMLNQAGDVYVLGNTQEIGAGYSAYYTPTKVTGFSNIVKLAFEDYSQALALDSSNHLIAWGRGDMQRVNPQQVFQNIDFNYYHNISYGHLGTLDNWLPKLSWGIGPNKYFANINDTTLPELNNTTTKNTIVNDLTTNSVQFFGLGTASNQSQILSLITSNNNNGAYYDNMNLDTALANLADYLVNHVKRKSAMIENYAVLRDKVDYKTIYTDKENDPINQTQWQYTHVNPNYFENSLGTDPNNRKWISTPYTTFNYVGEYTVKYKVQDNPKSNPNFSTYKLWSQDSFSTLTLYVHRRPIAQFTVKPYLNGIAVEDTSYDLDHISQVNKGIVEKRWKWKYQGDTTWNNGLPSTVTQNSVYLIDLQVKDEEGAWSEENIQKLTTGNLKNALLSVTAELTPTYPKVVLSGSKVHVKANVSYGVDMQSVTAQVDSGASLNLVKTQTEGITTIWEGDYTIPSNFASKDYYNFYVTATAINGNTKTVQDKVNVVSNHPPVANFSYSPTTIYEGDTITLTDLSTDPDHNITSHLWTIKDSNGVQTTASTKNYNLTNVIPGTYSVTKKVTDIYGLHSQKQVSINVYSLTVIGQVNHTTLWNQHRMDYNLSKTGTTNSPRTYDVFFPGEKFLVRAVTTDIQGDSNVKATQVKAEIVGMPYATYLNDIGNNRWEGSLWDEAMLKWKSQQVIFRFSVNYSNGVIKQSDVSITIDDDPYWRQHGMY